MSDTYSEFRECPKCKATLKGFAPALQLWIWCKKCGTKFSITSGKSGWVLTEDNNGKH